MIESSLKEHKNNYKYNNEKTFHSFFRRFFINLVTVDHISAWQSRLPDFGASEFILQQQRERELREQVEERPMREGDLLNLRDLEQGLEMFKRVPTADADIQIEPSEEVGQSDLVVCSMGAKISLSPELFCG